MSYSIDRRAFVIASSLIGLRAATGEALAATRAEDGTIRLGIVAPMSGPNARYGAFTLRGAQLAAKEINDAGGVGGRKITIVSGDSQGTPVEGVSATKRLIELDKVAGEPLDIVVNDRLIARGEAVVINDKFGIRITDIISKSERIARLR